MFFCNWNYFNLFTEGITSEHAKNLNDLKNLVQNLFIELNVEEHQIEREKAILAKLENLKMQIEPLEQVTGI